MEVKHMKSSELGTFALAHMQPTFTYTNAHTSITHASREKEKDGWSILRMKEVGKALQAISISNR